jgi:hypothetical protein
LCSAASQPSQWGGGWGNRNQEVRAPENGGDGKFRNDQRFLSEFFWARGTVVYIDNEVYHSNVLAWLVGRAHW